MGYFNDILPDECDEYWDDYVPRALDKLGLPEEPWHEIVYSYYGTAESRVPLAYRKLVNRVTDIAHTLFYEGYFHDYVAPMAEAAADARDAYGDWLHDCKVDKELDRRLDNE